MEEGSTGYSAVYRELFEDTRNIFSAGFVSGFKIPLKQNSFLTAFWGIGLSVTYKRIHKIAYGTDGTCTEHFYPDNTYEKKIYPLPQIDFGLNFGFGGK